MGFIKVPLFLKLLFSTLQKFGRLVLWEAVFILELHSAETQEIDIHINEMSNLKQIPSILGRMEQLEMMRKSIKNSCDILKMVLQVMRSKNS